MASRSIRPDVGVHHAAPAADHPGPNIAAAIYPVSCPERSTRDPLPGAGAVCIARGRRKPSAARKAVEISITAREVPVDAFHDIGEGPKVKFVVGDRDQVSVRVDRVPVRE